MSFQSCLQSITKSSTSNWQLRETSRHLSSSQEEVRAQSLPAQLQITDRPTIQHNKSTSNRTCYQGLKPSAVHLLKPSSAPAFRTRILRQLSAPTQAESFNFSLISREINKQKLQHADQPNQKDLQLPIKKAVRPRTIRVQFIIIIRAS